MSPRYYFPFLDGAIGYDCATCKTRCCMGLGFGLGRTQAEGFLARHPEVAPFVRLRRKRVEVIDLREGCFWLDEPTGLCRIERDEGRAAKPSVCCLFPFTRLYRVGEALCVEPHILLCPLEERPGTGVRHADLIAEIDGIGDEAPFLEPRLPGGLDDRWIDREEGFRERTAAHLDDAHPVTLQSGIAGRPLDDLWSAWSRSFALPTSIDRGLPGVARSTALLTPLLRMATILDGAGTPWPKLSARLPALLLGTAWMTALATEAMGRRLTLTSAVEVHRATAMERRLLARWMDPVRLDDHPEQLEDGALGQAIDDVVGGLDGTLPLGVVFDRAATGLSPSLRHLLLSSLARRASRL